MLCSYRSTFAYSRHKIQVAAQAFNGVAMSEDLNKWTNKWVVEVENFLSDLAPGERAAIIVELDAQLRKLPTANYEELVRTFGTPAQAANRYRLAHGKNPFEQSTAADSASIVREHYQQTSARPVGTSARKFFKYATLAVLSLFALFVASIFLIPLLIFKFIAVDNFEKDFTFTFGDSKGKIERFQGKLSADPLTNLTIAISNGQIALVTDQSATEITYECEIEGNLEINRAEAAKVDARGATLTLLNVENADCDLTVPAKLPLSVNVTSGRIALAETDQNVEANLTNGEIEFESAGKTAFEMTATAQSGTVDGLEKFQSKQKNKKGPAYSAVLSVGSGRIEIE